MDAARIDHARALLGSAADVMRAHGQDPDVYDPVLELGGIDPLELEAKLSGATVDEIVDELVPVESSIGSRTSTADVVMRERPVSSVQKTDPEINGNGHKPDAVEEFIPHPAETARVTPIGKYRDSAVAGRVPPHDLEAEENVLGAMMIDEKIARQCLDILSVDDFYRDAHQKIAGAITKLLKEDAPTDPMAVYRELARGRELQAIGGAHYLHSLVNMMPVPATAPYHAHAIAEMARQRHLIDAATRLAQDIYDDGLSADEALSRHSAELMLVGAATEPKIRVLTLPELRALPQPVDLIEGVMSRDVFVTLWGPSGHGKSLLALDIALSVATGRQWLERKVERGPVVMVVAEGVSGTAVRADAWLQDRNEQEPTNFFVVPDAVNLFEQDDPQVFVRAVESVGVKPSLVVFDTLARSMVGADENSARDLGIVIAAADWIRSHSHATVLVVHHSGRSAEHERGSTALYAASDTVISAIRNEDDIIVVESRKQKDRADFEAFGLAVQPVDNSVVLVEKDVARMDDQPGKQAIEILTIATRSFGANPFSRSGLIEEGGMAKRNVQRTLKWLVEHDFLKKSGAGKATMYEVTEKGESLFAP